MPWSAAKSGERSLFSSVCVAAPESGRLRGHSAALWEWRSLRPGLRPGRACPPGLLCAGPVFVLLCPPWRASGDISERVPCKSQARVWSLRKAVNLTLRLLEMLPPGSRDRPPCLNPEIRGSSSSSAATSPLEHRALCAPGDAVGRLWAPALPGLPRLLWWAVTRHRTSPEGRSVGGPRPTGRHLEFSGRLAEAR